MIKLAEKLSNVTKQLVTREFELFRMPTTSKSYTKEVKVSMR